ncbi:restriction endonuclease subunit S [Nocardioides sp. NPDC092400]|uniref:restriction endonuclease subunit S n=1 Tax=Nocardioides sp. NPDC092400 TaxID=3155196 RepID=UPI003437F3F5
MTALVDVFPVRFGGYWGADPGEADFDARAIRNGDVGTTGSVAWADLPMRGFTTRELSKARVRARDILLTTSGNCGNAAFLPEDPEVPTVATNFVRVLRVDPARTDAGYAFHFLRTRRFLNEIAPFVRGATIKNLSVEAAFGAVDMPTPPLAEQRRIAAILDHADAVRAKRRKVLTRLDALAQSKFQSQFADVPASTTVDEVALPVKGSIRTGPFGSQLLHSEFVDEGVAVLGLDNVVGNQFRWASRRYITEEKYAKLARYTVHPGDVLISIMGTTGRCVVVPDAIPTAINTKHICAVTPDPNRVDPEFLRAVFLWHPEARAHLRRQTKGSIMDGLNMGIIKSMPVPRPGIEAQRAFAVSVSAIAQQQQRVMRAASKDDQLFASLQSRAFRGNL